MRFAIVLLAVIVALTWAAPREKRQRTVIEKTIVTGPSHGGFNSGFGGRPGGFNSGFNGGIGGRPGGFNSGFNNGFGGRPGGFNNGFNGGPGFGRGGQTTIVKETVIRG